MTQKAQNILTTVVGILVSIALPFVRMLDGQPFTWVHALMMFCVVAYAYLAKNPNVKYADILTTVFGCLFAAAMALEPLVSTGVVSAQAVLGALVAGIIAYLTNKQTVIGKIDGALQGSGVSLPKGG